MFSIDKYAFQKQNERPSGGLDKGPRLECLTPCDPVEYWYYNAAEAELQGPKRLHPTQVEEIFSHGGASPVPTPDADVAVRRQAYGMRDQFQRQFWHPRWKRAEEESRSRYGCGGSTSDAMRI